MKHVTQLHLVVNNAAANDDAAGAKRRVRAGLVVALASLACLTAHLGKVFKGLGCLLLAALNLPAALARGAISAAVWCVLSAFGLTMLLVVFIGPGKAVLKLLGWA